MSWSLKRRFLLTSLAVSAAALIAAGTPEKQAKMRVGQIWQWIYHWGVRDFMAMTNLGCLYELKGDLDTSRIWFEQSLKSYPEQPIIPTNISNILNKKGSQAEVAGEQDEAKRLYQESAAYDKRNTAPLNSLGLMYARRQAYDSAFFYFNAALAINGEDRSALENFAVSSFLAKDYDQAIRLAQKHVLLYGNSRSMLGVLSDCYYAKGNYEEVMRLRKLLVPDK